MAARPSLPAQLALVGSAPTTSWQPSAQTPRGAQLRVPWGCCVRFLCALGKPYPVMPLLEAARIHPTDVYRVPAECSSPPTLQPPLLGGPWTHIPFKAWNPLQVKSNPGAKRDMQETSAHSGERPQGPAASLLHHPSPLGLWLRQEGVWAELAFEALHGQVPTHWTHHRHCLLLI